jgi:putative hydrolase of HD superfamily
MENFSGIVSFLQRAERLKATRRSGWTSTGEPETVAAHTWRLCLMAMVLADHFPEVNVDRVIRMLVIHDLGEAVHGDIPAPQQAAPGAKAGEERRDLVQLLAPLPEQGREAILQLWDEYEACETLEGKLAKGLDKLETIMQHNQGQNPADFDYGFNLDYGRRFTSDDSRLAGLRAMLDRETAARAHSANRAPGGKEP